MDFSENYACIMQNEIQSAHWHHAQVTVFTAGLWENGKFRSYVIVSDELKHGKSQVMAFLKFLLDQIDSSIKDVKLFSDGCAEQFKSKYVLNQIPKKEFFNQRVMWHFFATSHGKGVVDGIGGTAKRAAFFETKAGGEHVVDAHSFARAVAKRCPAIIVRVFGKADFEMYSREWEFESVKPIPGIRKMHCFIPAGENLVIKEYSNSNTVFVFGKDGKLRLPQTNVVVQQSVQSESEKPTERIEENQESGGKRNEFEKQCEDEFRFVRSENLLDVLDLIENDNDDDNDFNDM